MRRPLSAVLGLLCFAALNASAQEPAPAGTTILGDQDAAVGLFLAPWKEETRGELSRPPGLQDHSPAPIDAASYARATQYYAAGRAYRAERLQRNR